MHQGKCLAQQEQKRKNGKDADDEGIVSELLKYGVKEVECETANIFNNIMRGIEEVFQYWKNFKIMVLLKKGDETQPNNYRLI